MNKKNSRLISKIKELERKCLEKEKDISNLEKEIKKIKNNAFWRKPKIDNRIKYMMNIDEFLENKLWKISAGVCIYVICDENGERYVGQSTRNDYSRIKEHFDRKSEDRIYQKYNRKERQFYIERIIIGWKNDIPFNLDEVEAYYIAYYDSYENGYNENKGNHRENVWRFYDEFVQCQRN